MITTAYGTFYNVTGSHSVASVVADFLSDADAEWREQIETNGTLDAIIKDYANAIDSALPDNFWLSGDEFIGPHGEDENYDETTLDDLREAVETVDLAEIVKRHDEAATKNAMDAITEAVNARTAAAAQLDAADEGVAEAVRAALKLEVPATTVAEHLRVTRARVYQIRDGRR